METEPRRLHRLSWLFLTVNFAKGLIVPLLFVLFASASNPWARFELYGAVFIVPVLIGAVIKQRVFSYRFEADELTVRDGIVTRKERNIPYDRIHNIAVVRNLFHRLFDVASVRIETAGGGKPEAVLRVLGMDAVAELRRRALDHGGSALPAGGTDPAVDSELAELAESAESERTVLEVPPVDLVKLGLATGPGLVLAAVAGYLYQLQWWEVDWLDSRQVFEGEMPTWIEWLVRSGSVGAKIVLGILVVLLIIGLTRAVSAVWHLVKYWKFTLFRDGDDLRTDYGLLTNVSLVIPLHRIQLVTVRASIVHRWLRRVTIEFESAGSSDSGSDGSANPSRRQFLVPMLAEENTASFLEGVLPEANFEPVDWQALSSRTRRRILSRTSKITIPLTLAVALGLGLSFIPLHPIQALWIPALVFPLSWASTNGWLRYSAWGLTDKAVFFRSGWLKRSISMVPLSRVQSVTQTTSFFDRRRDMATITVDTAGAGSFGHRIQIPYLDTAVAEQIRRELYRAASITEFDW